MRISCRHNKTGSLLLAALLLNGCPADDDAPLRLRVDLGVDTARVDFGEVALGASSRTRIALRNRGQVALLISADLDAQASPALAIAPAELHLDVDQRGELLLSFAPHQAQAYGAMLRLRVDNGADAERLIAVLGQGVLPTCDDANPCTEDVYDLQRSECVFAPVTGTCDDGNACTSEDVCADGRCLGRRVDCDDGVDCTLDSCDPELGCQAAPEHSLCEDADPCSSNRCDVEQGCVAAAAPDGTLCGPLSCAQLDVCIGGRCQSGPTPDGMPCDDGDACTTGDVCQAGNCVGGEGSGRGLGVSEPIELALENLWDSDAPRPLMPMGILAMREWDDVEQRGVEVIWANHPGWQSVDFEIWRTRSLLDGSHVSSQYLMTGTVARAVYDEHELVLLVDGCSDCCALEEWVNGTALLRYGPEGELLHQKCLWPEGQVYDFALAAQHQETYLVTAALEDTPPQPAGAVLHVLLTLQRWRVDDVLDVPLVVGRWQQPQMNSSTPVVVNLSLGYVDEQLRLSYLRYGSYPSDPNCMDCDLGGAGASDDLVDEACLTEGYAAHFMDHLERLAVGPEVYMLGVPSADIGLMPTPQAGGVAWLQKWYEDEGQQICMLYDELHAFYRTPELGGLLSTTLLRQQSGSLDTMHVTSLFEQPAVLLHRRRGLLTVLAPISGQGVVEQIVPSSTFMGRERSYMAHDTFGVSTVATTTRPSGLVVAAITQPYAPDPVTPPPRAPPPGTGADVNQAELYIPDQNGIAIFHVGCGDL